LIAPAARGLAARCLSDRPAEVARFLATAAGRSFSTGEAFERALDLHDSPRDRRCFVVTDGDRLVAALPGRLERRFGGAWFRAQPHGTPAGPCFDRALDAPAHAAAAHALWTELARVARAEGWLGGDVTWTLGADDPPPDTFGRVRHDEAAVIDLAHGIEGWRGTLDKRARGMLRKSGERGVTLGAGDAQEDLAQVYEHFLGQARAWRLPKVRPLSFYRALLEAPTTARLWVARKDGRVLCGVLAFVLPEETYAWWSGSSPEARPLLAFPGMLARMIEDCGSARVNLGFSGGLMRLGDFKRQLGAVPVPVPILELAPQPRTPWHALLVFARTQARARARARSAAS